MKYNEFLRIKATTALAFTFVLTTFLNIRSMGFSGGDGSYLNPYQINTVEDLMELSNVDVSGALELWHKNYILTNDIVFPEQYESFDWNGDGSADWDLEDKKGFSPIGDSPYGQRQKVTFNGYFNGDGHYITNVYINRNQKYIGLFGDLGEGAIVEKVGIRNINISYKGDYIGGALTARVSGTQENPVYINECCIIGGNITTENEFTIGGLIGYADYAKVTNCYTTINLHGSSDVGGVIGSMNFGTEMKYCYASGVLSNDEGKYMIGGLVSSQFGITAIMEDCFWDVETTKQYHAGWSDYEGFTKLNTVDFSNKALFSDKGWNFQAKWKMGNVDGDNYIRPRLMWQDIPDNLCLNAYGISNQKISNTQAELKWTGNADSYEVAYALKGEITDIEQVKNSQSVNQPTIILQNLKEGKTYDVFIKSRYNNSVDSEWVKYNFCLFTNSGNGSKESPYLISTTRDLIVLTQNNVIWSSNFRQIDDIEFDDNEYNVDWNGDGLINILDAEGFSPIGKDIAFIGSYKGAGHVIRNIYMDSNLSHVAPFGYVNPGAIIDSLGIENIYIKSKKEYSSAAGLVGYALSPQINSCYTNGYIDAVLAGGLIGSAVNLTINNCYTDVEIHAEEGGGFINWAYYSVKVNNCYAAGKLVAKDKIEDIGGFISSYSNSLTANSSYWDINTTEQDVAIHDKRTTDFIGLKTTDFNKELTFTNWDFWGVWKIGKTDFDDVYRPRLKWQFESTYVVSGKVLGISNAVISAIDINTNEAITVNVSGEDYNLVVSPNQSIKITLLNDEHQFVSKEKTITNISENKFNVNFIPIFNIAFETTELGQLIGNLDQNIEYGKETEPVYAVPYEGRIFKYWTNENGDSITNKNPLKVDEVKFDMTFVPFFEIETFLVQFLSSANGTVLGDTVQIVEYGASSVSVEAKAADKWHFVKWVNESGDSITDANPIEVADVKSNCKYIAIFDINRFNLEFNYKGVGELIGETKQQLLEGEDAQSIIALAGSSYHFVGWLGSDNEIISSENPFTLRNITENLTITALFEANKFAISYNLNGGVNNPENPGYYTIESDNIILKDPTREGYRFVGWYTDEALSNETTNPAITSGSTGDVEFFAKWTEKLSAEQFEERISVYPNPTSSSVYIELPARATLKCVNLKGQLMYPEFEAEGKATIDMSLFEKGVYIVQIKTNEKTILKKIVKR